jgi:SAM-dependent methyltransferase
MVRPISIGPRRGKQLVRFSSIQVKNLRQFVGRPRLPFRPGLRRKMITNPGTHLRRFLRPLLSRYAKNHFLDCCVPHARILDVGCGNNSPFLFKTIRPDIYYVGLDVGDYNQLSSSKKHAEEYIIVPPEKFAAKISEMSESFDAVVSAHNLEHCNDPQVVLVAMLRALKYGGRMYLSFPCEASVHFPHRRGTLNFFDDPTHQTLPNFEEVLSTVKSAGCVPEVAIRRYRPFYRCIRGLLAEPFSRMRNEVLYGTLALYGFETIIWAVRPPKQHKQP